MNSGQRQIIAEKVASTVRVLELLGFRKYVVSDPRHERKKGNKSPRIVYLYRGDSVLLRIYNGVHGHTWANKEDGTPIREIDSVEALYGYLYNKRPGRLRKKERRR